MKNSRLPYLLLATACAACAGTETGNPGREPLRPQASVAALSSDPAAVAVAPSLAPITVEHIWMAVTTFEMVRCGGVALPVLVDVSVVDAVMGAGALDLDIPPDDYCGVTIRFGAFPPSAVGPGPQEPGRGFVLSGTRADGAPFALSSDTDTRLVVDSAVPFPAGGEAAGFFVVWDPVRILRDVEVNQQPLDDDGVARIARIAADGSSAVLAEALQQSMTLHADTDGDGVLDPDERPPL